MQLEHKVTLPLLTKSEVVKMLWLQVLHNTGGGVPSEVSTSFPTNLRSSFMAKSEMQLSHMSLGFPAEI